MKKFSGIMMAAAGILISVLSVVLKVKKTVSFSLTGGADGPTSIFLAGKVGNSSFMITVAVGILLLISGIFMIAKKK